MDFLLPILASGSDVATAVAGEPVGALFSTANLIALLTLAALEIVLGIDNVVFISILAAKLPEEQRAKARSFGLSAALLTRLALLFSISWVMTLTTPLFNVPFVQAMGLSDSPYGFSGRDMILLLGGFFLLAKATLEIHHMTEDPRDADKKEMQKVPPKFSVIIVQIALLDIVFSLDSVITAVGMVKDIRVMIAAVLISMAVMLFAAGSIASFIEKHPTMKMLALSFLLMIGLVLMIEGFHGHVAKAYIYFAMGFSLTVEILNMRIRAHHKH